MSGPATSDAVAAVVGALGTGGASLLVPTLIRRLPAPAAPDLPRPTYPALASWPALPWWSALIGALVGGTLGLRLGWDPALAWLLPVVPLGIALAYVDARIRLLPTRLIASAYVLVIVAIAVTAVIERDPDRVLRALVGWAVVGGLFGLLWWTSAGMGYGDVRLAGVLGLALAAVGWAEVLVGTYAAFVVGLVGWAGLRIAGVVRGRSFAFGPALLVGAWLGVLTGPTVVGLVTGG